MDDRLELRVLGGIELVRGDTTVPVGGPKPRLALAVLAAHRGSIVSTDRICEELWADDAPVDPGAVLQSHLSRLRRILRPDAEIVARPPGYELRIADGQVDAGRFELLCAAAAAASNPAVKVDRLQAALACWRGSAFEEFPDADWAQREAVRLEELRVNAREDLLEARLVLGEHAILIGDIEALVAEHPLRERAWQQLIVALYRSGRSPEALRRADALRRLYRDELGLEPSAALRELEARVLADDPTLHQTTSAPRRAAARRPPPGATRLVGRADELDRLALRVRSDRLVTLTGPGGVGKTRLALSLAAEMWDEVDGRVYVVELAPVHDPASAVAAIATALDVQRRQHLSAEDTLVEYLRAEHALLVLDNCEHLRSTIAPLAARLLSLCPEVTVLATSREVLGLPGEQVWRVGPLELAPEGSDPETIAATPAVRLFVDRADAARPGFVLGPDIIRSIDEIVRRLDGLPLAIELAGARMRAMSPAALAQRLDQGFDLLAGAQTAMTARHRTLQDLVAWSYDLLEPPERDLFGRLCVFAGSFALEAVEGVCGTDDLDALQTSVLLANLVDKSMVQVIDGERVRYRLLETLREFGRDHQDHDERARVCARHARWYLGLVEWCAHALTGPDEPIATFVLDHDFGNIRAAHLWYVEHGDAERALRLLAGLREFAFRNMRGEISAWAEATVDMPGAVDDPRYPTVLATVAYGRFVRGDLEGATEIAERAIAASERLGVDTSGLAERALGNAYFYRGDVDRALPWMDRILASARSGSPARLAHALYLRSVAWTSLGDSVKGARFAGEARAAARVSKSPTALAQSHYALGLSLEATDPAEAAVELQRAVDLATVAGNRWIQAFALTEVLWLEAREGRPREALARFADVVELWYRGGDWANQWLSLRHVYGILVQLRAHIGAATLHGALVAAGAAYALPFEHTGADRITELLATTREELGPGAFAAAVRHGATLTDGEIVDFARAQIHALAPAR